MERRTAERTYILGIDQGGSKTRAIVADDTALIRGYAEGPGGYYGHVGLDTAAVRIKNVCEKVIDIAEVPKSMIKKVVAGMTGADWGYEYPLLQEALQRVLKIDDVTVLNDCIAAFHAGTEKEWGVVLCSGTGFNAAVISPEGREFIFGFYAKGCPCGGKSLGNSIIRAVTHSHIGLKHETVLKKQVLSCFGIDSVDELLYRFENNLLDRKKIHALVKPAFNAASGGDPVAGEIIDTFCRDMANYAVTGMKKFDMLNLPVPVVLAGGVFKAAGSSILERITSLIRDNVPKALVCTAKYEPVIGTVKKAFALKPTDTDKYNNLEQPARRYNLENEILGDEEGERRR